MEKRNRFGPNGRQKPGKRQIPGERLIDTARRKASPKRGGPKLVDVLPDTKTLQGLRNRRRHEVNKLINESKDDAGLQIGYQLMRKKHQQEDALAGFLEIGTIAGACRAAGVTRGKFIEWVENDADFASLYAQAVDTFADDIEEVAISRAKTTSDPLMGMMLKAHKPNKYKERREVTGAGGRDLIPLSLIRSALEEP